jgi:dUTP pyrophosphatase
MEPPVFLSLALMASIEVKIINRSGNPLPHYETGGAAGMDVRAYLPQPLELAPMQRALVPTGLYMELPPHVECQVRPRSGLAIKQGITCLNTPGTIDSDYRGEIKVILINLSGEQQVIQPGDRIAQLVFQKVEKAFLTPVQEISETERSTGGFGSTGKQ